MNDVIDDGYSSVVASQTRGALLGACSSEARVNLRGSGHAPLEKIENLGAKLCNFINSKA